MGRVKLARVNSKFREAFEALAFREAHDGGLKVFAEYVSWDELIHTCYFNVPRFRNACRIRNFDV
jgi:hypothetical protein